MEDSLIIGVVAAVATGLLWSLTKTSKNLPLNWDTFSTFMADPERYGVLLDIDDRGLNADFGIQFRSHDESVMYFVSETPNHTAETIDLLRKGSAGFIVTFIDGRVSIFQRIGGFTSNGSDLQPQQLTALEGILKRTRNEANKYRQ